MKQELAIDETIGECRTALLEDGDVVEISIDRADHRSKVGGLYVGRVEAVRKALQAAFVELPNGLPGFLSVHEASAFRSDGAAPRIENLVHEGEWIIVEVMRDTIGDKGPRLTTQIALPGRLLAYRPFRAGITVSSRVRDKHERDRLRKAAAAATAHVEAGGFIVRTLASGASDEQLRVEGDRLVGEWLKLKELAGSPDKPFCLRQDIGPVERALRDWAGPEIDRISVDGRPLFNRARHYLQAELPSLVESLEVHTGPGALFEALGIEAAIDQALDSRVDLPHGGWIMIEHTEALTAIDVNSGENMGESDKEHTALATNLAAVGPLVAQLRLRDVGGMILIDFIHMEAHANRRKVLTALEAALSKDRAPGQLLGWSRMGLMELTRKRSRKPLDDFLGRPANPFGTRRVRNVESLGYDILRRTGRAASGSPTGDIVITASEDVVDWLSGERIDMLSDALGRRIMLEKQQLKAPDEYDVYVRRK